MAVVEGNTVFACGADGDTPTTLAIYSFDANALTLRRNPGSAICICTKMTTITDRSWAVARDELVVLLVWVRCEFARSNLPA